MLSASARVGRYVCHFFSWKPFSDYSPHIRTRSKLNEMLCALHRRRVPGVFVVGSLNDDYMQHEWRVRRCVHGAQRPTPTKFRKLVCNGKQFKVPNAHTKCLNESFPVFSFSAQIDRIEIYTFRLTRFEVNFFFGFSSAIACVRAAAAFPRVVHWTENDRNQHPFGVRCTKCATVFAIQSETHFLIIEITWLWLGCLGRACSTCITFKDFVAVFVVVATFGDGIMRTNSASAAQTDIKSMRPELVFRMFASCDRRCLRQGASHLESTNGKSFLLFLGVDCGYVWPCSMFM